MKKKSVQDCGHQDVGLHYARSALAVHYSELHWAKPQTVEMELSR